MTWATALARGAAILSAILTAAFGMAAAAAPAPDQLYQALLSAGLENPPPGQQVLVSTAPPAPASGGVSAVRITFPGTSARNQITYYLFDDSGDASAYAAKNLALPPGTGKLLPYPPFAQCHDEPAGGACDMVMPDDGVVIVATTAAKTDNGTAMLIATAYQHLSAVVTSLTAPPATNSAAAGPCGLALPNELAQALGGVAGNPQPDGIGGCNWSSAGGGKLSVEPKDGGRAQFDFDRTRVSPVQAVAGLGDDAFAFVSVAGFVQLSILKGDRYMVIVLQPQSSQGMLAAAQALGAKIAARM